MTTWQNENSSRGGGALVVMVTAPCVLFFTLGGCFVFSLSSMTDPPGAPSLPASVSTTRHRAAEMFMSKRRSFGGVPLTMSWYTGRFPGSDLAPSHQPTRQSEQEWSGSTEMAQSRGQHKSTPIINADDEGDSIELRLAPVQQDSQAMGPRGGGWGDDFGKEEGVGAWSSAGWGKGNRNDGGGFGLIRVHQPAHLWKFR